MNKPLKSTLESVRLRYEKELLQKVVPFWEKHSPDREHGGFFNCLDRDGSRWDDAKYVWLQGRETWLFAKLYRTVEKRPEWLELSKLGVDFLRKHALRPEDGRVYFKLARDGQPRQLQRKIFSECFYVMALSEYARAADDDKIAAEAQKEFARVWEFSKDATKVGRVKYAGEPAMQNLAVPMILLNLIEELTDGDVTHHRQEVDNCIRELLEHVHTDKQIVFENVAPDGAFLDTPEGRHLNPGHAIEAAWFLQHWARRLDRPDLSKLAIDMCRWSHDRGWDKEHGGLYYFLDSKGYSPPALEWDMKLWWPHCEALYAHLLNYSITKDPADWARFEAVDRYTFDKFPDQQHGEWYGYLNRRGEVTHRFKGGPYKCAFHVPRALLLCWKLLGELKES